MDIMQSLTPMQNRGWRAPPLLHLSVENLHRLAVGGKPVAAHSQGVLHSQQRRGPQPARPTLTRRSCGAPRARVHLDGPVGFVRVVRVMRVRCVMRVRVRDEVGMQTLVDTGWGVNARVLLVLHLAARNWFCIFSDTAPTIHKNAALFCWS